MTFSPITEPDDIVVTDDRPVRLVQAARDLATETGSSAFTVTQVTQRAGLSLKSFYRCFHGKDELLVALLSADSGIGAVVLAGRIGSRTGPEAVRAYFVELFDMLSLRGALGYAGVLVREHRRLLESHNTDQRAAVAPLIDLLAGYLETSEPRRDAETMFSVIVTGIHNIVIGGVSDTAELALYLHGFCTRGVLDR